MASNKKIRLIACDLDGTLRPGAETRIPEYNLQAIARAEEAGILFCPSTGRTFVSTAWLVGPVAERSYCICENGSVLYSPGGEILKIKYFDRDTSLEICRNICSHPDYDLMMTGNGVCYILSSATRFRDYLDNVIHETTVPVEGFDPLPVRLEKISAFCADSSLAYPVLAEGWEDRAYVTIAGDFWVDYNLATKGTGLKDLCSALGIGTDEVMAIGDNYNDSGILDVAGYPVLMSCAAPELLERYPVHCSSVAEAIDRAIAINSSL